MLYFDKKVLDNGLTVILHYDAYNPLASVNIHYKVGSIHDAPSQTGMAHLFEHLMFAGTPKVPSFDQLVQHAGGENNAFTTNDSTNYHITLPSENIDTALLLEADRMQHIRITDKIFQREKNVVLEEYKETTLNKPYGDSFQQLSEMAYKKHPYRWSVIGKNEKSIAGLSLDAARKFYASYYSPANAILSINSNIPSKILFKKVEKHFSKIPGRSLPNPRTFNELPQQKIQRRTAVRKGPAEAIYMAFHMASRKEKAFYIADVISDLLSNGFSTRLLKNLLRGKKLVSTIDAYITATIDPGLFIIEAKLIPGKSMKELEKAIWRELDELKKKTISTNELNKIKNTIESSLVFSEMNGLNRVITLAYFEMLGDAAAANMEGSIYQSITADELKTTANTLFRKNNCSILYYKRSQDGQGYFEDEDDED